MQTLRMMLFVITLGGAAAAGAASDRAVPGAEAGGAADQAAILAQPVITLADLFRLADLASPQLAAVRSGVAAEAGRLRQAGAYPNPEVTLAVEEMSTADPQRRKQKVELSQALPWGGRHGAGVAQARAEYAAAGHQAAESRRRILREVHGLWIELAHLREQKTALEELIGRAAESQAIARTRFEAKAAPEAHLTRAVLELYELEVMLEQAGEDEVRTAAQLGALLGVTHLPLDRLAGDLEPDHDSVRAGTGHEAQLDKHPRVLAANQELAAAQAAAGLARAARLPDLEVFVAYGRFEADEGNFVEGGVSLPLPLFDRNQGRVAEARAEAARAEHEARGLVRELAVALAAATARHDLAHTQLDRITADITPAAARGLNVAQDAYRVGRLMFLELVDAQRTYADVLLRGHELRRNLALAEADMTSLLGEGLYLESGVER